MTFAAADAPPVSSSPWRFLAGGLALAFAIPTLLEGGHTLFGTPAAGAEPRHFVPFVVAFNFAAGFAYLAAGAGTLAGRRWALWVARGLAVTTLLVFAAFGLHVLRGGAYEARTFAAMTIRSTFWLAQALVLARLLAGGRRG